MYDFITRAEHDKTVQSLKSEIETLKKFIMPYVERERDGEQILNWKKACEYVHLTQTGLNEARRQGRIKGLKINAKEFGYKKKDLDNYLNRYHRGN